MAKTHPSILRRPIALAWALGVVGLVVCCNNDSDIVGLGSGSKFDVDEGSKKGGKKKPGAGGLEFDGEVEGGLETEEGKKGTGKKPEEEQEQEADQPDPPKPAAPIDYPVLEYLSKGITTCDGDNYNTTSSIVTSVSDANLQINMVSAKIFCGGRCQEEADKEIAQSIGVTNYTRSPKTQLDQLFDAKTIPEASFAIFANDVTKPKGQKFVFDKPLPVFPFPSPLARYAPLDNGPMSWQANVTGFRQFTATVTIDKVGANGDVVTIRFQTTIAQDPGTRALYEDFPLPRIAIYEIDTKTRDVKTINSTNWFNGEKCDNKPEQVNLLYKMCKKTKKGVPETFPCN